VTAGAGPRDPRKGHAGRPSRRACSAAVVLVLLALELAACGKKGPPVPPPGAPKVYPRTYPHE
jgi:predicted small lipoprotein YifL